MMTIDRSRLAVAICVILCAPLPAALAQPAPHPATELTPVVTLPTGKSSTWVEVTPQAVWVASLQPNKVHRVAPNTNTVVATIPVPGNPCSGLAAGLGSLWVPLCGDAPRLAKIDVRTNRISAVFPVGPPAEEGGVTTSNDSVWLVTDKTGTLARINPTDGSIKQTVQLPADSYNPLYSDGIVWVTHPKGAEVTAVDAATGKVVGTVKTGPGPRFLTAGDGSVWTLNGAAGSVSRIDVKSMKVIQTVPLNVAARGGDIKFDEGRVWVTLLKTPLTAIEATSGRLLCQWSGDGGDSMGLGQHSVWLSNVRQNTISRFDTKQALAHCK